MAQTLNSQCRGKGFIPGQGPRSHMLQIRVCMLQLGVHMPQLKIPNARQRSKISCAATKTQHSQINKYFLKIKKSIVTHSPNWFNNIVYWRLFQFPIIVPFLTWSRESHLWVPTGHYERQYFRPGHPQQCWAPLLFSIKFSSTNTPVIAHSA